MRKFTAVHLFVIIIFCFLFLSNATAERLAVKAEFANVRSGPSTNKPVIWHAEKFYPLKIIKKIGNWYAFKDFEGDQGWVHKSLLGRLNTVVTKKDKCRIRSGAGTKFEVLFMVGKAIPFKVLKKKKNWLYVQHADGDKGWIHQSLVW